MKIINVIIWLAIGASFLRGLLVFDQGHSAKLTYPTASAICLVGSILCAILFLKLSKNNRNEL